MPKSLEELAQEYRSLAKKKRAILSQMRKMLKGKRITAAPDVRRNEVISKKNKSFMVADQFTLSGDEDYGDLHVCFKSSSRGHHYYRRFDEVIIENDPLVELLKEIE